MVENEGTMCTSKVQADSNSLNLGWAGTLQTIVESNFPLYRQKRPMRRHRITHMGENTQGL